MYGRKIVPMLRPGEAANPYCNWENFDPRVTEFFCEENRYYSGPGSFLPPEQQPFYNFKGHTIPYKLCIRGIHPHTTEDGITHIMNNYGNPLLVERKRTKFNEVIAFVEFRTPREAENAIIALDCKPPLNWRVTYAYSRSEDRFLSNLEELKLASEIDSQESHLSASAVPSRALPSTSQAAGNVLPLPAPPQATNFPPCIVCGIDANTVCVICKTRYCSQRCQRADWPDHQKVCIPPPPLVLAGPEGSTDSSKTSNVTLNKVSVPFVHKPIALPGPSAQPIKANDAHAFVIKGITPLDPIQPAASRTTTATTGAIPKTSPKMFALNLSQEPSSSVPSPVINLPPQQPRTSVLAAQTTPLQSTLSSVNPSPVPEIRYAKTYPKPTSPFSGNGQKHLVYVCFAKSPEEFYVQHASNRSDLSRLSEELQSSASTCDGIAQPVLGAPCAAVFETDGLWYRAQILRLLPNNEIGVRFIDYGNTAKMANNPENFRMLELKFAKQPGFAVTVRLADVVPPNGTTWESYVKASFSKLVQEKEFLLEVVRVEEDQLVVRLENRAGLDLGSELVKRGLAKSVAHEPISNDLDPRSVPPGPSMVPPPPQVAQRPVSKPIPQQPTQQKQMGRTNNQTPPSRVNKPSPKTTPQDQFNKSFPKTTPQGQFNKPSPKSTPQNQFNKPSPKTTPQNQFNKPSPKATPPNNVINNTNSFNRPKATPPQAKPVQPQATPPAQLPRFPSPVKPKIAKKKPPYSILTKMAEGSEAKFLVTEVFGSEVIGALTGNEYMTPIDFHSTVEGYPIDEQFSPPAGVVVSVFSEKLQNWFRGYILAKRGAVYDVLYVDWGNVECGIKKVKPFPPNYHHPELAVKMILPEALADSFVKEEMFIDSTHSVVIDSVEDGFTCTLFEHGDIKAELLPWPTLVPRVIPLPQWEVGQKNDVIITTAEDIDRIFVQLVVDEVHGNMIVITQKLAEMLERFDSIPKLRRAPKVGSYVAAVFAEDGALYRARVVSTEGETVNVEFVDYGNLGSVALDLVRPLPDELFEVPACGRFVKLSHVEKVSPLPEEVKTALSEISTTQSCSMTISAIDEVVEVVLNCEGSVINERISDLLVSLEPVMPELTPAAPEPVQQQPQVDYTIGEFDYNDGPFVQLPEKTPFHALILSNDHPRSLMLCPGDADKLKRLIELQEEIQKYADSILKGHSPALGEICLARAADGIWYRAACIDITQDGSTFYSCIQVDYGEVSLHESFNLRRIPKRFVEALPYMAIQAGLKEAQNVANADERLVKRLQELLPLRALVELTVVDSDGEIKIVDIPGVGDQLVSEGFM